MWLQRLPQILDVLRGMDSIHLVRQAVEQLCAAGERRARQLMAGLAGIRAGNASAIWRRALVERLEATAPRRAADRVFGRRRPGCEAGGNYPRRCPMT